MKRTIILRVRTPVDFVIVVAELCLLVDGIIEAAESIHIVVPELLGEAR